MWLGGVCAPALDQHWSTGGTIESENCQPGKKMTVSHLFAMCASDALHHALN